MHFIQIKPTSNGRTPSKNRISVLNLENEQPSKFGSDASSSSGYQCSVFVFFRSRTVYLKRYDLNKFAGFIDEAIQMKPLNEINEMVIFGGRLWDERTGFGDFFLVTFTCSLSSENDKMCLVDAKSLHPSHPKKKTCDGLTTCSFTSLYPPTVLGFKTNKKNKHPSDFRVPFGPPKKKTLESATGLCYA